MARRNVWLAILVAGLVMGLGMSAAGISNPSLVKDINPGGIGSSPIGLVEVGGTLFFTADDGVNGQELWKSDGTAAGTVLVKDIWPGSGSSVSRFAPELVDVGAILFFSADDGVNGEELWKSDGTAAGTVLVKDINPGSGSSVPESTQELELVDVGGILFFSADDGVNGEEVWKSDGTAGGTVMVKDINPGSASSVALGFPRQLVDVGGTAFFTAYDDTIGIELWKSDGTAAGTTLVKDIAEFGASSPEDLVDVGGTAFFTAYDETNGEELWKSDGTAAGTVLVKDINPGSGGSSPGDLAVVGGTLFFSADDGVNGGELWSSDGSAAGTVLVKNIWPGGEPSHPEALTAVGSTLFFVADNGVTHHELWKSDGTAAGTVLVRDIYPGGGPGHPDWLVDVAGVLYFSANDGANIELWSSDGTAAGTVMVQDINPGPGSSNPFGLTAVGGNLFFSADDGSSGRELWGLPEEPLPDLALFDPASGKWHLRYRDGHTVSFFYGVPGDTPLMGDWDCDGTDTVAMYRESTGFIYYRNSNNFGVADGSFFFGIPGDIPIAGDWDNDGCDTFGIYRNGKVFVSNVLATAFAEKEFFFGVPGDRPFAGDFTGDGIDTIGLYRQTSGLVYFTETLPAGDVASTDNEFFYGVPSDRIVVDDWDLDGDDSVGIYRPGDQKFYLSYENILGNADVVVPFGQSSWLPAGGDLIPQNPGDVVSCGDFATQAAAQAWHDLYYHWYGDIANLDGDANGLACESLP